MSASQQAEHQTVSGGENRHGEQQWEKEKKRCFDLKHQLKDGDKFQKVSVLLKDIRTWAKWGTGEATTSTQPPSEPHPKGVDPEAQENRPKKIKEDKEDFSDKVSIYEGDITHLQIDAIVNAANSSLRGGGGVDGAIHRAAGRHLYDENVHVHKHCDVGEAKISGGYDLSAKYIISTVGPQGEKPDQLKNAYRNCLEKMREHNLKSIAFPCISTGVYGYPNASACEVALQTTKSFLQDNHQEVDRVIFCLFMDVDKKLYKEKMREYFPVN